MSAEDIDFEVGAPVVGQLNVRWIHGSPSPRRRTDPPIQVHAYEEHTYVLRESKDISFEAPFLYLLFGNHRALLVDTGATADPERFPIRSAVDRLIGDWLTRHPRTNYELVVAHSHSHTDHRAGDPQFIGRPLTRVVGKEPEAVRRFFGLSENVDDIARFDLGGRGLEVFSIPGHHPASIAVFDRRTGFLLTGDTVYPGRLYVFDFDAFRASLDRLVRFAGTRTVTWVLGGHVEMTQAPFRDYPMGARFQQDERALAMTVDRLKAVRDAAESVKSKPGAHGFEDFAIYNGPCTGALLRQMVRGTLWNLRYRFGRPTSD